MLAMTLVLVAILSNVSYGWSVLEFMIDISIPHKSFRGSGRNTDRTQSYNDA